MLYYLGYVQSVHMTKGQNSSLWTVFSKIQDTKQLIKFTISLPGLLQGAKIMTLLKGLHSLRNAKPIAENWPYLKGN